MQAHFVLIMIWKINMLFYKHDVIITSKYDLGAKVKLNTGIFWTWVERIRMQNFHSSNLNTFINCLSKSTCHRLKITDAEVNGVCCDNRQGWHNVCWNGKSSSFILIFFFDAQTHFDLYCLSLTILTFLKVKNWNMILSMLTLEMKKQ